MRLGELRNLKAIPDTVLLDLLSTNQLPVAIDDEGYLCITLSKTALKELINSTLSNVLVPEIIDDSELLYMLNQVICEEVGNLIFETRLKLHLNS